MGVRFWFLAFLQVSWGYNFTLTKLLDEEALCGAGNRAGYYVWKSPDPGHADNWQVILSNDGEGQLWCLPPGKVNLTSTAGNCWFSSHVTGQPGQDLPATLDMDWTSGFLSNNCTSNPIFCKYNRVLIQACEGSNWFGNADHVVGNRTVMLRGQRILNSTLQQVVKDLHMSADTTFVMTGYVGGAFLLYQMADRIGDYLNAWAGITKYTVVNIDGFWPEWKGYFSGNTYDFWFGGNSSAPPQKPGFAYPDVGIYEYGNCSGAVNPECLAATPNEADHWRCMLPETGLKLIKKTRIFAFEQAWGTFGSFCSVNALIVFDPAWHGWHVQCDPRDGSLHLCVEYGWKCSPEYVQAFVNTYINNTQKAFNEAGVLQKPGNGGFMHSCHLGGEDALTDQWDTIAIDNVTMRDALNSWWNSPPTTPGKVYQPCLWGPQYLKPYKNCCNPTCPNIPYFKKASNQTDTF